MQKFFLGVVMVAALMVAGCSSSDLSDGSKPTIYASGALESLAQCLTKQGAKMYGATWCPHCQQQKADFGTAAHLLPYVECGAGPQQRDGQTAACALAGIFSYPTWVFKDGTRAEGQIPLVMLARSTGCPMPVEATTTVPLTGSAAQR